MTRKHYKAQLFRIARKEWGFPYILAVHYSKVLSSVWGSDVQFIDKMVELGLLKEVSSKSEHCYSSDEDYNVVTFTFVEGGIVEWDSHFGDFHFSK